MSCYMSPQEIRAHAPDRPATDWRVSTLRARQAMQDTGQWHARQVLGRRWAVGCVALEITQRCNLDCTLCYLSDHAESVKDIPLEEVWRRIDMIRGTFGPGTNVQVTGGDPTLRKRSELVAIVRRLAERELRPALFTNGIKATRDLLRELKGAGLVDVAFHVDTTQERKGYATEADLNAIRLDYIARARGLGLAVYFNTTIHDGNLDEVSDLARFFVENADVVDLASFQLQADTGRGTLRARGEALGIASVERRIRAGAGDGISFAGKSIGHAECNRYAMALVANGRPYDLLEDEGFIVDLVARTAKADLWLDRARPNEAARRIASFLARNPRLAARGAGWVTRTAWRMGRDILAARGRVHRISFFIHNFMDACHLDRDRIKACSFKVATSDGPISMCLHNAKRDDFVLRPIRLESAGTPAFWDPLTGKSVAQPPARHTIVQHPKLLKGRVRAAARAETRR